MQFLFNFWNQIPPGDRKLVRFTALACSIIFLASIAVLYLWTNLRSGNLPVDSSNIALLNEEKKNPLDSIPPPPLLEQPKDLDDEFAKLDLQAHRELARIRASRQDFKGSLLHLERIAPSLTDDPEFQTTVGQTFLEAGKPQEAILALHRAMTMGNQSIELRADLALAYFHGVHPDSGIIRTRALLRDFPQNPLVGTQLATMLSQAYPTLPESQQIFEKLLNTHPNYAKLRYQFGRHLMNRGNFRSALVQLEKAIQLEPIDSRMRARLGMALFHLKIDKRAEIEYRTALSLNPRDYNTWFNLGELFLSQANESVSSAAIRDQTRQALECFLRALELQSDHGMAHLRAGMILNGNRQHREAIQHLEKALEYNPRELRTLIHLATAWNSLGDQGRALDYLSKALEIDPFNRVVQNQWQNIKG